MRSDYLADAMLDHFMGGDAASQPAATYVALFTVDPGTTTPAAGELEVVGLAYVRPAITWVSPTGGAGRSRVNENRIEWPLNDTGDPWPEVTHFAIYDSDTVGAGEMLWKGGLEAPIAVPDGRKGFMRPGALIVEE